MIQKFKKLPVIVEAVQFQADYKTAAEIIEWINKENGFDPKSNLNPCASYYYGDLTIRTLEGDMHASKGDWIIKGISGEFYPCKPEIFKKTYEPIINISDFDAAWFNHKQEMSYRHDG